MIKITLNDTQAAQSLQQIANQLKHPRKLYGVLGETLKKIHTERFKLEVDPDGKKWQPLAPKTLVAKAKRGKSRKILRQDGNLADRLAYNFDDRGVEFGSEMPYARLHQFGGKAGRGHKVTIPARPWLGVNQQDGEKLLQKATALLQQQINQLVR
ncbi:phage virion morphogenesis protein [Pasteurellaceae bacterium 22721_9_1]